MLTVFAAGALLRSAGLYADDVLRLFGVMQFIQTRYVNAPNTTKLIDGAIGGMVSSLDDPHSVYMPPSMFKELRQHTEGSFGGIGVTMGFKDNIVKIISVLEGTPGEAAGLRAGDEILAVDGTPTSEMQNEEVALRIRGEAGTQVVLRILRDGAEQEYTITRDIIQVASVRGILVEGTSIGYIRIGSFAEHTGEEFGKEMNRLADEGMTSLIIDLRENPGGLITSCVAVAEQVVPAGVIVSVIDRDGGIADFVVLDLWRRRFLVGVGAVALYGRVVIHHLAIRRDDAASTRYRVILSATGKRSAAADAEEREE